LKGGDIGLYIWECRNDVWDKLVRLSREGSSWDNRTRHKTLDTFKAVISQRKRAEGWRRVKTLIGQHFT